MLEVYEQGNGDYVYILPRGGKFFSNPITRMDRQTLKKLDQCASLWPIENSEIVTYIKDNFAAHPVFTHWVACETAFFSTLPEIASTYAIPGSFAGRDFNRLGANGIFHQWVTENYADSTKIVSVCLNSHPDVAAILEGRPIDSSSGYSLLGGIPGATTCGDIDPSIVTLLAENGCSPEQIEDTLYSHSGWQALTGKKTSFFSSYSGANREVNPAKEILLRMLVKWTGAMMASLGGANRIVIGCEKSQPLIDLSGCLKEYFAFSRIQIDPVEVKRKEVVKFLFEKTQHYLFDKSLN